MIGNKVILFKIVIAVIASAPILALATNGMNPEGTGPKNRGMGGAGVAMATETQSIIINPAAVTGVGNRQDIAFGLFNPNRSFTITGNNFDPPGAPPPGPYFDQSQDSDSTLFAIPFYGYSRQLDDGAAWAFTISGAGGMNSDYPVNFGAALGITGPTGVDLAQIFFGGTYGAKFSDDLAWGVTVSLAYAEFAAEGLEVFGPASSDPANLTNNGTDSSTGIGLKVGLLGQLKNGGTWGASYQFETDMSEFDKYKGLFADQGDLDIAPTFTVGVALPIADKTTLALDYHYIDYEAVPTISNSTSLILTGGKFGDSGGPGFGWQSISVIKAGIAVETAPDMIWRGGINIGESPLTSEEISTAFLVPATIETHLTVGFTKQLSSKSELTGVFVHSLENCQSGPFSVAFGGGIEETCMDQNFIELSYGKMF